MFRALLALFLTGASAHAVTLVVDYSYASGYFQQGTAARAAIESAAADLSAILANTHLAAVTTRTASGSASWNNGEFDLTTTVNFSASYVINHPSTGDIARLAQETWAENEIRIYVGMRQFIATSIVGDGSPAEVGLSPFGAGYAPSWKDAINTAANNASELFLRGADIRVTTINDALPYRGAAGNYDVSGIYSIGMGPTAGAVWLNAGIKWDTARGFWDASDFDGQTYADEYSLYSVAIREMMRALGTDPVSQVGLGQQAGLAAEDLLALQNNGWITTQIPEPGSALLTITGFGLLFRRHRKTH